MDFLSYLVARSCESDRMAVIKGVTIQLWSSAELQLKGFSRLMEVKNSAYKHPCRMLYYRQRKSTHSLVDAPDDRI